MKQENSNQQTNITPTDGDYLVTAEMASHWLSALNYVYQRVIRSYHVTALANEMKNGRFRVRTQINFCQTPDQAFHLVNGQHTLAAIVKSGIGQTLSVVITQCKNMREVADDFARYDTHLTRQISDSLYAHEVDKHFGLTKSELKWVTAASMYYSYMIGDTKSKTAKTVLSNDEKLKLVMLHGADISAALKVINGHYKYYLVRKSTVSCMAITRKYDNKISEDFWLKMAEYDGLRARDPRKHLLEFLKSTGIPGGNKDKISKTFPDHIFVKNIAIAWKAYIEQREITLFRPDHDAKTVEFKNIGIFYV
jgi:hypothetical protein